MEDALTSSELLWEEGQRAASVEARLNYRAWLVRFALVFALIVFILAITMLLPDLVHIHSTAVPV